MGYTAQAAIKAAGGQVGYRESGTNNTKFNHWLGRISGYPHDGFGYAWCCSFQGWCADQGGGVAGQDYPRTAGCAVAVSWFKSRGRWSTSPHVGDWVFYGPHGTTHVELVAEVHSASIVTIGGNTSGSLEGRYFAGDGVYRKTVSRNSSRIYGYGCPLYDSEEDDMKPTDSVEVGEYFAGSFGGKHYPAGFLWVGALAESKRARQAAEANGAAVAELSKALAALAADRGQTVDVDALVQRIETAIESVKVRLDVEDETA